MDVIIRKAQIQDVPDIMKMNDIINEVGSTEELMKYSLGKNQNEIVFVAIQNEVAVGFVCGQLFPSICYGEGVQCEVTELFVYEDYRNQGIATKLITHLEHEFEKSNVQEILLQTGKKNTIAQKFYEKNGYTNTERVVYRKKYW
jgi:ribosomal protein S18 acetylase RimI-like enzyme